MILLLKATKLFLLKSQKYQSLSLEMMNVGLPFRLLDILVNGYKGHYFCSNTLNKMSALIVSNLILKIRLYHFLIITNSCEIIIMEA
jgi:hypothetical protein